MTDRAPCSIDGCDRAAAPRSALCWGHLKQRARYGRIMSPTLRERYRSLAARVNAAVQAVADADSDEDYTRAQARLRMAMLHRSRKLGHA